MIQNILLILNQYEYILKNLQQVNPVYNKKIICKGFADGEYAIINSAYPNHIYRLDMFIHEMKCIYIKSEYSGKELANEGTAFSFNQNQYDKYKCREGTIKDAEWVKELITWVNYPRGAGANANPIL